MTRRHTPQRLTLDAILPYLRTKRVSKRNDGGRQVLAYCPAHDDRNHPSLSLTEKADGTLLWKCFAGCSQDAVREALERLAGVQPATARPIAPRSGRTGQRGTTPYQPVRLAELADAKGLDAEKLRAWHVREIPAGHAPEAPYGGLEIPHLLRDGALGAIKYRLTLEKVGELDRFKWRTGDPQILYGLWRLPEWGDADTLYLCEGISDTWSLWHAGLAALGIPSASVWKSEWWDEVKAFERIVLIADADDAGAELAQKLAKTCPKHLRERVQVLQLPDGVKDANELWQRVDADPERFKEALAQCEITPLPDCLIARLPETDDLPLLAPLGELLTSDAERALEYVPLLGVDGLIARGVITLIGAHPKAGKTTLLVHACREWVRRGLRVVYLSEEPHAVWRERVKRFPELGALIVNTIPRAHPEHWARAIRELQEGPDIVIVDTIRRFLPAKDENDSALVSAALAPFVDLTRHLPRTAIVLVHHTKKNLNEDGEITDIAGSLAYTAEVDMVFRLAPVREHKRQRVLTPIAGRLWTLSPEPLVLELSEDASEYRVVGTAEEVLPETHAQSTREKVLQAIRVLGQATRAEIEDYLRELGEKIPERTIKHALLGLYEDGKVEREGKGTRAEPHVYRVVNSGNGQSGNDTAEPLQRAEPYTYSGNRAIRQSGNDTSESLQSDAALVEPSDAPPTDSPPALPDLFTNRAPLVWDLIDDYLQSASNPDDPFGLEPAELDAIRVMLAFAEARGFPALVVDGYRIHGDMAGWIRAAQDFRGTPAVARATRLLHALDAGGTPHAPTHDTLLRNGDAGRTPSQLSLLEG